MQQLDPDATEGIPVWDDRLRLVASPEQGDVHSCAQAENSLRAVAAAFGDLVGSTGHAIVTVCPVCSVRAGGWAGEWEGTYRPECTIPGPCEVLRTMAGHYRVPLA